jgi:hypothetical protein
MDETKRFDVYAMAEIYDVELCLQDDNDWDGYFPSETERALVKQAFHTKCEHYCEIEAQLSVAVNLSSWLKAEQMRIEQRANARREEWQRRDDLRDQRYSAIQELNCLDRAEEQGAREVREPRAPPIGGQVQNLAEFDHDKILRYSKTAAEIPENVFSALGFQLVANIGDEQAIDGYLTCLGWCLFMDINIYDFVDVMMKLYRRRKQLAEMKTAG